MKRSIFALVMVFLVSLPAASGAAGPWYYSITGPGGSNDISIDKVGQILYFELDATKPDYIWGNIRVDFETSMLECVSIEENPAENGFWTAWVKQAADTKFGGGGTLYNYDNTGLGSDWAKQWVTWYGPGNAGPVASYDNEQGIIRFYAFTNAGGLDGALPLRIGFRVKQAGTAVFTTSANDWTSFGWPSTASNSITAMQAEATTSGTGFSWNLEDLPYKLTSAVKISSSAKTVILDIKPGTCENVLNSKSQGVLPVAVIGTKDLDVSQIDSFSIKFQGVAPDRVSVEDVAAPADGPAISGCPGGNLDGIPDLIMKFDVQALVATIETALGREIEDGEVVKPRLTGIMQFGNELFAGEDFVVIKRK